MVEECYKDGNSHTAQFDVVVKVQREESSSFMTHSILFTMNVDASGLVRGFMDDGLGSCELVACNESIAEKNETEGKCYAGR